MNDPHASIETLFVESISDQDQLAVACAATQKVLGLIKAKNDDERAFLQSDEYRNSPYIKKLRKLDRDRQADGAWNDKRREDYAQAVRQLFDRGVRPYLTGLSEEEKSERLRDQLKKSKAKYRAAMTDEQIQGRNEKNKENMRLKRAAAKAIKSAK